MDNILITGASGFIGSFIVEGALERGFKVWAGVRPTSSRKYLKDPRIQFIELNAGNAEELKAGLAQHVKEFGKFDYVVHCAGATKCAHKDDFERINYSHTKNIADSLIALDVIPKQFIFISSLSVFGPIQEEAFVPISEEDTPRPNTAYGCSKLKAERYLQGLGNFPYVIYRPTGVYGPREKDYFLMVKAIQKHTDFAVGFSRQDLTFIYVKDLVQAIFLGIDKQISQRCYFLADGKVYRSRSFSDLIRKELGNPFVIRLTCPLIILKVVSLLAEFLALCRKKSSTLNSDKYKIMKQRNWQCDIIPAVKDLGFSPEYDLEKGVKETIAWYRNEGWL
ncbi:NAD(P)-dependent oxidoreductase [Bacteroidaceae bacterium HV4-6-C5C]|nr:NAD(P)-dependent oxidoreductase [Bacteroidaceae bacterium HV4-6-C5C]